MSKVKKAIIALAAIAILIVLWLVAYHNHKSTSNLPQLSAIALMDEADVNELLVGYYRTQLPDVWEVRIQSYPVRIHGSGRSTIIRC